MIKYNSISKIHWVGEKDSSITCCSSLINHAFVTEHLKWVWQNVVRSIQDKTLSVIKGQSGNVNLSCSTVSMCCIIWEQVQPFSVLLLATGIQTCEKTTIRPNNLQTLYYAMTRHQQKSIDQLFVLCWKGTMNNLDYLVPTVIPIERNKAMIMHMKNNSK